MNNQPSLPEELMFGPEFSLRANLRVNSWAFVAMLLSLAGDLLLERYGDWNAIQRAVIAIVPLAVSLLWVRSFVRWVRGMDEMHRRLTFDACLFATVVTLFVVTAWHLLDQTGIFPAKVNAHFHTASFPISLVLAFYFVGYARISRRYK
ncbi:MAG TPA: hypothetical protein VMV72_13530 [Verrucomicrobiae bacterium]|nr:hypothetical protein [Verrucomicrobiae bacterium]